MNRTIKAAPTVTLDAPCPDCGEPALTTHGFIELGNPVHLTHCPRCGNRKLPAANCPQCAELLAAGALAGGAAVTGKE